MVITKWSENFDWIQTLTLRTFAEYLPPHLWADMHKWPWWNDRGSEKKSYPFFFSDILLCTNAPRNFDRCKDAPPYKIAYRVRNMIAMPKGKIGDKARWIYYITLPSQKYFIILAWNRSFTLTAYHFCTRFVVSVPMRALEQFALPEQNHLSSLIFWR